ncbi:hypothetical protein GGF46_001384 [Coemansia sp. RSA 552]|nr:hypothetical protein GGF46_001384 [Coemansia sp. RSA 552]
MTDAMTAEKRKRQESVHGSEVLLEDEPADTKSPSENAADAAEPVAEAPEEGEEKKREASPSKRPRTSEDGDEDSNIQDREETSEPGPASEKPAAEGPTAETPAAAEKTAAKTPTTEKPTAKEQAGPVFGMSFASSASRGLSGFAAASKSTVSPFAALAGASNAFSQYAKSPSTAASEATEKATEKAAEEDSKGGDTKKGASFEALLTANGKESLATNAAMSTVVPAMAHANVSELSTEPVRTYEEDETCVFSTKAKLYELVEDNWKERGGGQFKLNQHTAQGGRHRLVMRTDQTYRLILNVPLFVGMKLSSERRFVRFTCFDTDRMAPVTYALRFASEDLAAEAHSKVSRAVPTKAPTPEEEAPHDQGKGADEEDSSDDEDYEASSESDNSDGESVVASDDLSSSGEDGEDPAPRASGSRR